MERTIKLPPIMEEFSDTIENSVLEKIKNYALNSKTREEFCSTANFFFTYENGDVSDKYYNAACHSYNRHTPTNHNKGSRRYCFTENGAARGKFGEMPSFMEPFLQWLIHDSPFSPVFLNKDDEDFMRNCGFILSGNAPANIFHLACVATRHFREVDPNCFHKFNELKDKIHPFLAFQICFNTNIYLFKKISFVFNSSVNHRTSNFLNIKNILKIISGDYEEKLSPSGYVEGFDSVMGSSSLFYVGGYGSITDERKRYKELDELILKSRDEEKKSKVENKVYRPPNPFVKGKLAETINAKTKAEKTFSTQEFLDIVVPFINEKIKGL